MPVRNTAAQVIARVRTLIGDPAGTSQQFDDQTIQDTLDEYIDFIRYEPLQLGPSIVNAASTSNQASVIFADYYSQSQWWEQDVVLQGVNTTTHAAWVVLTPVASDYINGHWQFELDVFNTGTAPGQYPPVFATGRVHDPWSAAADLLELWAATVASAYDISVNGQSLRRSQLMTAKITLAEQYRRKAKPRRAKLARRDVNPETTARRMRLLDSSDLVKGA